MTVESRGCILVTTEESASARSPPDPKMTEALSGPGLGPTWTSSDKDFVTTALEAGRVILNQSSSAF